MNDIVQIRKAVDRMEPGELKSCLRLVLNQIRLLKEQTPQPEGAAAGLVKLYDQLTAQDHSRISWEPDASSTHVHIVTGESFAGSMKLALRELGLTTHRLVTLKDNYAIGPIGRLDTAEGRRGRSDWFRNNMVSAALEGDGDSEDEYHELLRKLNQIPEQAQITVWTGSSVQEQTGLRYALHLLRGNPNTIRVCDAYAIIGQLDSRPERPGTDICRRSGEIPADKLREALMRADHAPALSSADIARLADEWTAISRQGGILRIWRDGEVREVPADHFDRYLLESLDRISFSADADGFVRSARLIGEAVGHCEQDIGDEYFEFRLRELVYAGVLEIRGIPAGMRYYSIRRRQHAGNR